MKKTIAITILSTMVVIFIILLTIGLNTKEATPVKSEKTNTYMNRFKSEFMSSCVSENATYAYCSCTYEDLLNKLGENGFIKMSVKYTDDEIIPDEIIDSAKQCIHLN